MTPTCCVVTPSTAQPYLIDILKLSPGLARSADSRGVTPLHLAATNVLHTMVDPLLEAGARADEAVGWGSSPIFEASVAGDADLVDKLLRSLPSSAREKAAAEVKAFSSRSGNPLQRMPRRARLDPPRVAAAGSPVLTCMEGGGWDVEPPPTEEERKTCQIDQRTDLTEEEFYRDYFLPGRPVLRWVAEAARALGPI